MTKRTEGRIELPYGALVEATVPLLVADEAFVAERQQYIETLKKAARNEISREDLERRCLRSAFWEFKRLLDAGIVASWPPPLHDHESMRRMIRYLESNPEPGWGMWYFVVKVRGGGAPERLMAIGIGGFKGPPSSEGTVEIEYSTVEPYDFSGTFATTAVGVFLAHAFEDPRVQRVVAEHSPLRYRYSYPGSYKYPSIVVFERNGFVNVGPGSHTGAIRFQRDVGI